MYFKLNNLRSKEKMNIFHEINNISYEPESNRNRKLDLIQLYEIQYKLFSDSPLSSDDKKLLDKLGAAKNIKKLIPFSIAKYTRKCDGSKLQKPEQEFEKWIEEIPEPDNVTQFRVKDMPMKYVDHVFGNLYSSTEYDDSTELFSLKENEKTLRVAWGRVISEYYNDALSRVNDVQMHVDTIYDKERREIASMIIKSEIIDDKKKERIEKDEHLKNLRKCIESSPDLFHKLVLGSNKMIEAAKMKTLTPAQKENVIKRHKFKAAHKNKHGAKQNGKMKAKALPTIIEFISDPKIPLTRKNMSPVSIESRDALVRMGVDPSILEYSRSICEPMMLEQLLNIDERTKTIYEFMNMIGMEENEVNTVTNQFTIMNAIMENMGDITKQSFYRLPMASEIFKIQKEMIKTMMPKMKMQFGDDVVSEVLTEEGELADDIQYEGFVKQCAKSVYDFYEEIISGTLENSMKILKEERLKNKKRMEEEESNTNNGEDKMSVESQFIEPRVKTQERGYTQPQESSPKRGATTTTTTTPNVTPKTEVPPKQYYPNRTEVPNQNRNQNQSFSSGYVPPSNANTNVTDIDFDGMTKVIKDTVPYSIQLSPDQIIAVQKIGTEAMKQSAIESGEKDVSLITKFMSKFWEFMNSFAGGRYTFGLFVVTVFVLYSSIYAPGLLNKKATESPINDVARASDSAQFISEAKRVLSNRSEGGAKIENYRELADTMHDNEIHLKNAKRNVKNGMDAIKLQQDKLMELMKNAREKNLDFNSDMKDEFSVMMKDIEESKLDIQETINQLNIDQLKHLKKAMQYDEMSIFGTHASASLFKNLTEDYFGMTNVVHKYHSKILDTIKSVISVKKIEELKMEMDIFGNAASRTQEKSSGVFQWIKEIFISKEQPQIQTGFQKDIENAILSNKGLQQELINNLGNAKAKEATDQMIKIYTDIYFVQSNVKLEMDMLEKSAPSPEVMEKIWKLRDFNFYTEKGRVIYAEEKKAVDEVLKHRNTYEEFVKGQVENLTTYESLSKFKTYGMFLFNSMKGLSHKTGMLGIFSSISSAYFGRRSEFVQATLNAESANLNHVFNFSSMFDGINKMSFIPDFFKPLAWYALGGGPAAFVDAFANNFQSILKDTGISISTDQYFIPGISHLFGSATLPNDAWDFFQIFKLIFVCSGDLSQVKWTRLFGLVSTGATMAVIFKIIYRYTSNPVYNTFMKPWWDWMERKKKEQEKMPSLFGKLQLAFSDLAFLPVRGIAGLLRGINFVSDYWIKGIEWTSTIAISLAAVSAVIGTLKYINVFESGALQKQIFQFNWMISPALVIYFLYNGLLHLWNVDKCKKYIIESANNSRESWVSWGVAAPSHFVLHIDNYLHGIRVSIEYAVIDWFSKYFHSKCEQASHTISKEDDGLITQGSIRAAEAIKRLAELDKEKKEAEESMTTEKESDALDPIWNGTEDYRVIRLTRKTYNLKEINARIEALEEWRDWGRKTRAEKLATVRSRQANLAITQTVGTASAITRHFITGLLLNYFMQMGMNHLNNTVGREMEDLSKEFIDGIYLPTSNSTIDSKVRMQAYNEITAFDAITTPGALNDIINHKEAIDKFKEMAKATSEYITEAQHQLDTLPAYVVDEFAGISRRAKIDDIESMLDSAIAALESQSQSMQT